MSREFDLGRTPTAVCGIVTQDERRKIRTQEYRGTDRGVARVVVVVMAVVTQCASGTSVT